MRQGSIQLVTNGDMTTTITSVPVSLQSQYAYSIQGVWTGGAATAGTFQIQVSDDTGDSGTGPATHWTVIPASVQMISGTPGDILYDVTAGAYRWIQFVYIPSAGSGTLNVMAEIKGV